MKVAIFDVDGTLANNKHREHHLFEEPKNWKAFFSKEHLDTPIISTKTIMNNLFETCHDITVFAVTARNKSSEQVTKDWLQKNNINYDKLIILREDGNYINDDELKTKYINSLIETGYEPVMIFEDRKRIADAIRAMNIPNCVVYHVAEGDF